MNNLPVSVYHGSAPWLREQESTTPLDPDLAKPVALTDIVVSKSPSIGKPVPPNGSQMTENRLMNNNYGNFKKKSELINDFDLDKKKRKNRRLKIFVTTLLSLLGLGAISTVTGLALSGVIGNTNKTYAVVDSPILDSTTVLSTAEMLSQTNSLPKVQSPTTPTTVKGGSVADSGVKQDETLNSILTTISPTSSSTGTSGLSGSETYTSEETSVVVKTTFPLTSISHTTVTESSVTEGNTNVIDITLQPTSIVETTRMETYAEEKTSIVTDTLVQLTSDIDVTTMKDAYATEETSGRDEATTTSIVLRTFEADLTTVASCLDIGGKCGDEIFEVDFCSDGWTWDYDYVCDPSYLHCCKPPSSTSDSDDLSGDVETELTTASIPVREDFTTVSPSCVDIGGKCGDEIFEADFCSDGWTWDYDYVCDPSYLYCCKPPSSTSDSDDLSGDVDTELTTANIPVREDFTTVSPSCVDIGGKCGDEIFEADFCSDGWTWDYDYMCDPSYLNCCKPPSVTVASIMRSDCELSGGWCGSAAFDTCDPGWVWDYTIDCTMTYDTCCIPPPTPEPSCTDIGGFCGSAVFDRCAGTWDYTLKCDSTNTCCRP